jgi:hypothetical protein
VDVLEILKHLVQNKIEYCMEVCKGDRYSIPQWLQFSFSFSIKFSKSSCFVQVTPTTSFGMDNDILNSSQQKFQVGGILTFDSLFPP